MVIKLWLWSFHHFLYVWMFNMFNFQGVYKVLLHKVIKSFIVLHAYGMNIIFDIARTPKGPMENQTQCSFFRNYMVYYDEYFLNQ